MRNQGRSGNTFIQSFAYSSQIKKFPQFSFSFGFRKFNEESYWGEKLNESQQYGLYFLIQRHFHHATIICGGSSHFLGGVPLIFNANYDFEFINASLDYDGSIVNLSVGKRILDLFDIRIGGYMHPATDENGVSLGVQYNSLFIARSLGNSTVKDVDKFYAEQIEYYQPQNVEKRVQKRIQNLENELLNYMQSSQKELEIALSSLESVKKRTKKEIEVLEIEMTMLEKNVTKKQINEINQKIDDHFEMSSDDSENKTLQPIEQIIRKNLKPQKMEPNQETGPVGGMSAIYSNLKYPEDAKSQYIQGEVQIQVSVDEFGDIVALSILDPNYYGGIFNMPVENAVQQTAFHPASDADGNPIAGTVTLTIKFTFSD